MIDETPRIKELHAIYQRCSGIEIVLSMQRMQAWRCFLAQGYNEDDLRLAIELLRRKICAGKKTFACLRFGSLIGNLEWFGEDLGEARAMARVPKQTAKEKFCEEQGRPPKRTVDTARPVRNIIAENAALSALLKLRDSL